MQILHFEFTNQAEISRKQLLLTKTSDAHGLLITVFPVFSKYPLIVSSRGTVMSLNLPAKWHPAPGLQTKHHNSHYTPHIVSFC